MTQEELLYFIEHITRTSSRRKFEHVMDQLCDILEMQNTDPALISLVRETSSCYSDLSTILAEKKIPTDLTLKDLQLAEMRREARRKRAAEERARYGRC